MQAAFLVHVALKKGTSRKEMIQSIEEDIVIDIDNESGHNCIEGVEVFPTSALVYNPDHGPVVVYQP